MQSDDSAVREAHTRWIAAVNAGDLATLLGSMTDDAVFLSPGQVPVGRAEFPAGFSAAHERFRIRCASELQEVVIEGSLAYTRCRDSLSLTPRAGGDAAELAGHRITLYRRQPGGHWLLTRDAHTLCAVASADRVLPDR